MSYMMCPHTPRGLCLDCLDRERAEARAEGEKAGKAEMNVLRHAFIDVCKHGPRPETRSHPDTAYVCELWDAMAAAVDRAERAEEMLVQIRAQAINEAARYVELEYQGHFDDLADAIRALAEGKKP